MARGFGWHILALLTLAGVCVGESSVKSRYTPSPSSAASNQTAASKSSLPQIPSQDPRDRKFGSDAAVKKILTETPHDASSVQPAVARSAANADVPMELVTDLLHEEVKEGAADKAATQAAGKLRVCIASADFWGLKAAGGTATAYHLMAAALAKHSSLQVSMLQVTKRKRVCEEAAKVNTRPGLEFHCLQPAHFEPEVAETFPYEAISMAVLSWIKEQPDRCQVLHGHEWGGAFVDVIMSSHFRQLQPGFRVIVEPHGGHVWSQLGELLRPMEVVTLRIDNAERMASQLADQEISPTQYMVSFLRQRGWQLPNHTLTIPNIIPEMEANGQLGKPKPVHKIAFFSRLDERKGIKLFVEAVSLLPHHKRPDFEVYIVGPESQIDMMPSSKWLAEHTSRWTGFKTHLLINIKRDEALDIISAEGMLLVLCSMVDNMPYVVAEAAVKGIPFLAFDAGGVLELFDHHQYPDNIVWDPTAEGLSQRIAEVMSAGEMSTVQLMPNMSTGKTQWVQWHLDHAASLPRLVQEDKALIERTSSSKTPPTLVLDMQPQQSSLDLWEEMCTPGKGPADEPVLLLPPEYEVLNQATTLKKIGELLQVASLQGSRVKALTFGIKGPKKVSMPTSPTWMAYAGDGLNCIDAVPIAIQRGTFCNAYLGQARVFRVYSSWILAMLLGHQNLQLMAFPEILFSASDYTMTGQANCAHDKVPLARAEAYRRAASHLFRDSDDMLRAVHLAAGAQPLVSLLDDVSPMQGHKGWRYGYFDAERSPGVIQPLEFVPGDSGELLDGKWACSNSAGDYPSFSGHLLHPCTHDCCGGSGRAPFVMQLTSNFYAPEGVFILAYDAFPVCGDGVDFTVDFHPAKGKSRNLLKEGYDPVPKGARPSRKRIEVEMLISPGDIFEFVVDPRENQDCDGIYIVEAKIWQSLTGSAS